MSFFLERISLIWVGPPGCEKTAQWRRASLEELQLELNRYGLAGLPEELERYTLPKLAISAGSVDFDGDCFLCRHPNRLITIHVLLKPQQVPQGMSASDVNSTVDEAAENARKDLSPKLHGLVDVDLSEVTPLVVVQLKRDPPGAGFGSDLPAPWTACADLQEEIAAVACAMRGVEVTIRQDFLPSRLLFSASYNGTPVRTYLGPTAAGMVYEARIQPPGSNLLEYLEMVWRRLRTIVMNRGLVFGGLVYASRRLDELALNPGGIPIASLERELGNLEEFVRPMSEVFHNSSFSVLGFSSDERKELRDLTQLLASRLALAWQRLTVAVLKASFLGQVTSRRS